MKTTATFTDLRIFTIRPTLVGLDAIMATAKVKCPPEQFPELKLGKTYRFTTNVLREYAVSAMEVYESTTTEDGAKLAEAYTHLDAMLSSGIYTVDETFATVLRSEMYKLRNAIKALSPKCTDK